MNDTERIYRLEVALVDLTAALLRWGTERDGNWGHEDARKTFQKIHDEIHNLPRA